MTLNELSQIFAGICLVLSILLFGRRLRAFNQLVRLVDRANPKGIVKTGIFYAYTLGMAPWSKESTRLHMLSYLRGVAFHVGIFLGLGIFLASPWIPLLTSSIRLVLAAVAGMGAVFGMIGFFARFLEASLKSLSTTDDFFSVLLVSLFLAVTAYWLVTPAAQSVYFLVGGVMLLYAPFSKIRHCIYFAYSRWFYGKFIGSRAVLPHSQQVVR